MQTLPSFAYLLPLMLLFGIGAPAAVVCTLIYSLPPLIRIAAQGLQHLPQTTLEATDSMGQTRRQRLLKVELPMAKRTIIVGIKRPRWRRSRWPPSPPSSTDPVSASRSCGR
jgi:glycine betaine/proline transport system permease protein